MKNNIIPKLTLTFLVLILTASWAQAKSAIVGDIILLGNVERSGQKLVNECGAKRSLTSFRACTSIIEVIALRSTGTTRLTRRAWKYRS